jgi:hypothetical protein
LALCRIQRQLARDQRLLCGSIRQVAVPMVASDCILAQLVAQRPFGEDCGDEAGAAAGWMFPDWTLQLGIQQAPILLEGSLIGQRGRIERGLWPCNTESGRKKCISVLATNESG